MKRRPDADADAAEVEPKRTVLEPVVEVSRPPHRGNRRGIKREIPSYLPQDKDVFERQAIEQFLFDVSRATGKEEDEIYLEIKGIWKEQGFVHPKVLEKQLFAEALAETISLEKAEERIEQENLINFLVEESYPKDSMTDFESKSAVPLASALANLYAIETGVPVCFVEGDFGNMGGSNDFYRERVREVAPEAAKDPAVGFKYTDALARVTAGIAQEEFLKAAEAKGGISIPFRNGGDEIRYIVVGLTEDETCRIIEKQVAPKIEEFVASVDSSDHKHIKHKDDPYKNGFGLALGVTQVGNDAVPVHEKIENAEKDIDRNKVIAGANRQGAVSEEQKKQVLQDEPVKQTLLFAKVQQCGIQNIISGIETAVKAAHIKLEGLKKECRSNGGALKVLDEIIAGTHPKYGKYFAKGDDKEITGLEIAPENHKMFEPYSASVANQVNAIVFENDPDPKVLEVVADRFESIDPSSELNTPRDLKKDMALAQNDTQELQAKGHDVPDPKVFEIRFGSLGPINDGIGHQQADEVLKVQAQIICETLKLYGMKAAAGNIAHKGGATYQMVVPGIKTDEKGIVYNGRARQFVKVRDKDLETVFGEVEQRCCEEINDRTIGEFFEAAGKKRDRHYPVPDELKDKTFAELHNPKKDVNGITVSMASVNLEQDKKPEQALTEITILGEIAEKAAIAEAQVSKIKGFTSGAQVSDDVVNAKGVNVGNGGAVSKRVLENGGR
ncbi:MAG: hypothetical protein GY804_04905 [Alphaproteobacteria bacterium]|nr:hypothetical protein [Alphaproteobacteria bacterium]